MKNVGLLVGTVAVLFLFSVAHATVWYVHPDSTLNSIQAGIDLCGTGDTVLVGAGTYIENINFNGMEITVKSEYGADTTIIDGSSPAHPDSGSVVLFISGEDANSVLRGFTITNGTGTVYPGWGAYGGGIHCGDNSSPTIDSNTVIGNTAVFGGGIQCNSGSSPLIAYNTISANNAQGSGGAIELYDSSSPTITGNIINGNNAADKAGGISCYLNCLSLIIDNEITSNSAVAYGGGLNIAANSSPIIRNNLIQGNSAFTGGGFFCHEAATPTIDSCLISDNQGDEIYCQTGANPTIHYNNLIDTDGYLVFNADSSVTVDAEYNWWGDSSGPYHPTGNPSGQGGAVSDYVDFDPWLPSHGVEEFKTSTPVILALQVSPNPFRNFTDIIYQITDSGYKTAGSNVLRIYDATGRLIKDLSRLSAISHQPSVRWDATDESNRQVANGVYFVKFSVEEASITKKLLLVK
jgi:parallel beta-helix repeat protein